MQNDEHNQHPQFVAGECELPQYGVDNTHVGQQTRHIAQIPERHKSQIKRAHSRQRLEQFKQLQ